jgi:type VI secretion system protein ImpL
MMSLRRIFGLILLFLFFEVVVAVLAMILAPEVSLFLACAAMTGLALLVWLLVVLILRLAARGRSSGPESATQQPQRPAPEPRALVSDAFTTELRALIREADGRLAASPAATAGRSAKPTVASLPLYLIVGAPEAGKTSTLANSGLEPQLLAGDSNRDSIVVPTHLCNLWFAAGAVFADVSGPLFLDEPDRWETLLRVLCGRQRRSLWRRILGDGPKQQNVKGVLLFCDANGFMRGNDPQAAALRSRKTRERLQTVGAVLGYEFPVYVVTSKSDAIPYFAEYFAHLSDTEDQRVLGATLPFEPVAPSGAAEVYVEAENRRLSDFFNRLYASVADKRMLLLARENESARKSLVYEFPRELKRIRGELVAFLVDVFRPNPLQCGPRLRGFYFSGVRSVVHAVMIEEVPGEHPEARVGADATVFFGNMSSAAMLQSLASPQSASAPTTVRRWAFVAELFNNIITRDHMAPSAPVDRRVEIYRTFALGLLSLLLLILCFAWTISWSSNRTLLNETESTIATFSNKAPDAATYESLQDMDALRVRLATLEQYEEDGPPTHMRWGLYAGNRALPAVRRVYFDRFRRVFLNRMLPSFSGLLAQPASRDYNDIYDHLKVYRMITSGECRPSEKPLDHTLPEMWPGSAALSPDGVALANRQIRFYISELVAKDPYQRQVPEDQAAIKQAQAYLMTFKGPDKMLRGLVEELNHEHEAISLAQYASNYREVLSGPDHVDYAYTRPGWDAIHKRIQEHHLASVGEPCVLGAGAIPTVWMPGSSFEKEIEGQYVKDYIQLWKQFVGTQDVLPYQGFADAARKLQVLSDNNRSPLLAAIFMISANTNFASDANPMAQEAKKQVERSVGNRLSYLFPRTARAEREIKQVTDAAPAPVFPVVADIARAFQPAQAVVSPANADRWLSEANRGYVTALGDLGDAFRAMGPRPDPIADQGAYDQAYKAADRAWAAVRQLEQTFNNTPEQVDLDLRHLVEAPIERAKPMLPQNRGGAISAQINGAAQKFCADIDRTRRKYPFTPGAQEEAGLDELTRLLAPGTGTLAHFVSQAPMVNLLQKQGNVWVQNPSATQNLSARFLDSLNQLSQLSDALFAHGSGQPRLEYSLALHATGPIIFMVQVDGQNVRWNGGSATEPVRLSWPGAARGAKLIDQAPGQTLQIEENGVWDIFRLLDHGENPRPGSFTFSKIRFAGSDQQLQDVHLQPLTLQIQVDPPTAFGRGKWRLDCSPRATQ